MDGPGLLMFIYSFNIRFQELVALVAQTYALNKIINSSKKTPQEENVASPFATSNPSPEHQESTLKDHSVSEPISGTEPISGNAAFSKVLKNLPKNELKELHSLKYGTSKIKICKHSGDIKEDIAVSGLDSSFLLNLMLNTDFLGDRSYKETCKKNHLDKCCGNCDCSTNTHNKQCRKDHSKCNHKCNNCGLLSNKCGKVCCDVCKVCIHCNEDSYFKYRCAMMSKPTEENIKKHSDCLIANVKDILDDGLKFRNLFHLTTEDCQNLISGECNKFGGFTIIKTPDDLFKLMKICTYNLISLICDDRYFAEKCDPNIIDTFNKTLSDLFTNKKQVIKGLKDILNSKFDFTKDEKANIFTQLKVLQLQVAENTLDIAILKKENERKEQEFFITDIETVQRTLCFTEIFANKCVISMEEYDFEDSECKLHIAEFSDKKEKAVWDLIKKERFEVRRPDKSCTYFIIDVDLKTGYNYLFNAHIKKKDDEERKFISGKFKWEAFERNVSNDKDLDETFIPVFKRIDSNIIVCAYNDGTPSNVHNLKEHNKLKVIFVPYLTKITRAQDVAINNSEKFREQAVHYMEVNELDTLKSFPPFHLIEGVAKTLVECLGVEVRNRKFLVGYNYIYHLELFGMDSAKRKEDFQIEDCPDKHKDTVFFADVKKKAIFYFRISQESSSKEMMKEIHRCNDFLKAFLLIHEESLKSDEHFSVCSMVVFPTLSKKEVSEKLMFAEHHWEIFVLSKEDLNSNLNKKIADIIQAIRKLRPKTKTKVKSEHGKNGMPLKLSSILSECIATMALVDTLLPRLTSDPCEQIFSLFLNIEQYEAIHNPNQHRIIRGPFGSGKSLILEQIAKQLFSTKENGTVIYVCFDPCSFLEVKMAKLFENLKKTAKPSNVVLKATNIYKLLSEANKDVKNYDLTTILEHLINVNGHTTHFLMDETDGSRFTKIYSQRIKKCLQHERFRDATVVFAMQSTKESSGVHDADTQVNFEAYCLDDTGMKLLPYLENSMRMVGKIFKLKDIAEKIIVKKPSILVLHSAKKNIAKIPVKQSQNVQPLSKEPSIEKATQFFNRKEENENNVITSTETPENSPMTIHHINKNALKGTQSNVSAAVISPKKVDVQRVEMQSSPEIEQDVAVIQYQELSTNVKGAEGPLLDSPVSALPDIPIKAPLNYRNSFQDNLDVVSRRHTTSFKYPKSKHGVKIDGEELPKVIYLNDDFNLKSGNSGLVLAEVLRRFCFDFENDVKSTLICTSIDEAHLARFCVSKMKENEDDDFEYCCFIPCLEDRIPSFEEKKNIWDKVKRYNLLITDYAAFRGCESENCIAFINQDEKYARHVLVEVFARAVVNLLLLVLPSKKVEVKNIEVGSLRQCLHEWKEQEAVTVHRIAVEESESSLEVFCDLESFAKIDNKDNDGEFGSFKISKNRNSMGKIEAERQALQDFQDSAIRFLPPEKKKENIFKESKLYSDNKEVWDQIAFLKKNHFGLIIGQKRRTINTLQEKFNVKIQVSNKENKVKIKGKIEDKLAAIEKIKSIISDSWEEVNFLPNHMNNSILKQKNKYEKKHHVEMQINRNQRISIKGKREDKNEVIQDINFLMSRPGIRKTYPMGLENNDILTLTKNDKYPELGAISNFLHPIQLFYGVPNLKSDIIKALGNLKSKMPSASNCEASVIVHLGEACFKLKPGEYKVKDILKTFSYKKMSRIIGEHIAESNWVHRNTYCKYDFQISVLEEPLEFRYKIFLEIDNEGNTVFKHEIVEKAKQFNKDFEAGPGYFSHPDVNIARFDVFDPHKNLDLRLTIKLYESDPIGVRGIEGHLKYLEESFCSNIKIKPGTYDLDIPALPDGYRQTYFRKSLRKVYAIEGTSLLVKLSEESSPNGNLNGKNNEEFDIYIENVDMNKALKANKWVVNEVSNNLESIFNLGKNIIQSIK